MKNSIYTLFSLLLCAQCLTAQVCPGTPGQIEWHCWQGMYDDEFGDLTSIPTYPTQPDVVQTRYSLQAPANYDNYMGGRMEGFLYVPTTDTVTFNITGNNRMRFYLSTDANPANKVLVAFMDDWSNIEEHNKYPSQTSVPIVLQAGVDYYFEVVYVEGGGSDHALVWWKTNLVNINEWNVITAAYLKGVACKPAPCDLAGTPCDDGDASTTDDQYDGYCHCMGTPTTSDICIGDRGLVEVYRYDSLAGSDLNTLLTAPDFPAMPDYSRTSPFLGRPYSSENNSIGRMIQGFLSVPVSGNYKFNVTGDDQTVLFISSDNSPANKQAHQVFVSGWTGMTEHDKYIWQSTSDIFLQAGQYYYVEMLSKEGGGGEHFSAFWQTPFTETGVWKRIPSHFIFDYDKDCELACIAEFTPCDDGDPFTNNDQYDANCNCVGTPCSGPDCDSPLANYVPYEKCNITDQIDNNASNNWLSCQVTDNPNPIRPRSHWIQYDLQVKHELYQTQVWNYNVSGATSQGFEMVAIDYSLDGSTWIEEGVYNWTQATGDSNYSGFPGPDFAGAEARYVLITSLDDTTTCRGIGKIAFTAIKCPYTGTPCNDEDPNTVNDAYDENCICVGTPLEENQCIEEFLVLGDTLLSTDNFSAKNYVQSISQVDSNSRVSFIGGTSVSLNVGFETEGSTVFLASIDTCEVVNASRQNVLSRQEVFRRKKEKEAADKLAGLQVIASEGTDVQLIKFYIDQPGPVKLLIQDKAENTLYTLIDTDFKNKGLYTKRIRTKKLDPGYYTVALQSSSIREVEKLVVQQ